MSFVLKMYSVRVDGFGWSDWEGRSPGQARAAAWRSYTACSDISFRRFLKISSVRRAIEPEGFGRPILVGDVIAYWVGWNGQYVRFVRPGSHVIVLSHPNDVSEVIGETPAQRDAWIRSHPRLRGRAQYEASLAVRPHYHDGTPRPLWDGLPAHSQWSWNREVAA